MDIEFVSSGPVQADAAAAIAAPIFDGQVLSAAADAIDAATAGAISRALAGGRFTGAKGQVLDIPAPHGVDAARVLLIGAGPQESFDALAAETMGAAAFQAVKLSGATSLELKLADLTSGQAAQAAFGVRLAAYRFDRYLTKEKPEKKPSRSTNKCRCSFPRSTRLKNRNRADGV